MARLNARSLLRGQIRAAASRAYGQQEVVVEAPQEEPKTFQDINDLKSLTAAGKKVMALRFETYCEINQHGITRFHQQMSDGSRFSCTPVMPKDMMGNDMRQPGVYNSATGYLVLRVSDNAKLTRTDDGQLGISVRPEFVAFVPTVEEAEKLEAASNPKAAAKK